MNNEYDWDSLHYILYKKLGRKPTNEEISNEILKRMFEKENQEKNYE